MDQLPLARLKVLLQIVFLLKSTNIMWLQGDSITGENLHLHCVNDFLFTINCSLNMTPSENTSFGNSSHWLTFNETFEQETFVCELTNTTEGYFCSTTTSTDGPDDLDTFMDMDAYEISLCRSKDEGSYTCELLDDDYTPVTNIKPNAPCCLTISHNSSQHHFIWKSTYEKYSHVNGLMDNLQYQLHFYKTGDKHKVVTHDIKTDSKKYSVDDEKFEPDTTYAARVRSSPNMAHYMGQWSEWSFEVSWRTEPAEKGFPTNMFAFELRVVFGALSVAVILMSLLCYASVKKWRRVTYIPTPAPYFHTLYTDCQGDFKSWVITQENTAGMLKAEETLQINTLIKCVDIQHMCPPVFQQQTMDGSEYRNIPGPPYNADLQGLLYTDMGLLSAQGSSVETLPVCSQSGSLAEDSGCWLSSDSSLEKEPRWYRNDYCTLSRFQHSGSVAADHNKSLKTEPCQMGIINLVAEA
ncbi:interleukin-21 receptor [Odontesthes bonariensis]|uniref:interleukin-21 receptor n=1 Tax=Odontesthes bonariensis TaxID=219752 RepID=UPI003F58B032